MVLSHLDPMEYGIQRRSIYLIPPGANDLEWMLDQFEKEEIWKMFGFAGPSRALIKERRDKGTLVIGIIHRVTGAKRIGFIVCFPPTAPFDAWEFGAAIPDQKERDAFSAIHAADAMTHYMFDHLRIERGMWRTRDDNHASNALARRIGYRPYAAWEVEGVRYQFFRMDRPRWEQRLDRLDRGEERSPSGLGDLFVTLPGPPYAPKPLRSGAV